MHRRCGLWSHSCFGERSRINNGSKKRTSVSDLLRFSFRTQTTWIVVAATLNDGVISIDTLFQDFSMLSGSESSSLLLLFGDRRVRSSSEPELMRLFPIVQTSSPSEPEESYPSLGLSSHPKTSTSTSLDDSTTSRTPSSSIKRPSATLPSRYQPPRKGNRFLLRRRKLARRFLWKERPPPTRRSTPLRQRKRWDLKISGTREMFRKSTLLDLTPLSNLLSTGLWGCWWCWSS